MVTTKIAGFLNELEGPIRNSLKDRKVSKAFLVVALVATFFPLLFPSPWLIFENADMFKLSLFLKGTSPYSVEPWAAPYPPLYFILWSLPYLISMHFSATVSGAYFGLRLFSSLLSVLCAFIVYKTLCESGEKVGNRSKEEALSLSSLFLFCSGLALVNLVGDMLGLVLVALSSYFFAKKKDLTGLTLLCAAVAFKIHPIIGLVLVLASLLSLPTPKRFFRGLAVSSATIILLGLLPLALIPGGLTHLSSYQGSTLQFYSFDVYSGAFDVLSHVVRPFDEKAVLSLFDLAWIAIAVTSTLLLSYSVVRSRTTLRSASAVDLLSLGTILWLLTLKQAEPHYFLWALLPLIASRRLASSILVVIGSGLGTLFFSIGFHFTPNFSRINFGIVPNLDPSVEFLVGGILLSAFYVFAAVALLVDMRKDRFINAIRKEESCTFGSTTSMTRPPSFGQLASIQDD